MNKDELVLTAALTRVNDAISRYVFRVLDEANGNGITEYTTPIREVEYALGTQLVEMSQTLKERARARGLVVVEGHALDKAEQRQEPPDKRPGKELQIPEF